MKRYFAITLAVLMLVAMMAGCGLTNPTTENGESTGDPTQSTSSTPKPNATNPSEQDPTVDPNFVEDNTVYYLVGSGLGDLADNNWNISNDSLTMQRQADSNRNLYVIEITLYAGDQFQICHDYDWVGQQGIGYMAGVQYSDDTNTRAEVKDANGNVVFYGTAQYEKPCTEWNFVLAEGQNGVYRITLETFPADPSKNVVTFELVSRLDGQQGDQDPSTNPNFVEDNTVYYLVGAGLGDLAANNWNISNDSLTMQRQDYADRNVYVIEISLYAGDQFQICHDYDWTGQQGIGLMVGAELVSADKVEVKDANGTVIFYEYMEHDNPITMWNVTLAEGQDGVYRFTLETFPADPSKNVLTYELVERLEPQQQTPSADAKMHVLGSFNNWNTADTTEAYYMTLSADGTCYQVSLTATAGTTFKVHNQTTGTWHPDGMGNDLYIPEDGTYLITYTIATGVVSFEKVS